MRKYLTAAAVAAVVLGGSAVSERAAGVNLSVPGQNLGPAGRPFQLVCRANREKRIVEGKISRSRGPSYYRRQAQAEWRRAVSSLYGQAYAEWALAQNRLLRCAPLPDGLLQCGIAGTPCTLKR